MRVRSAVFSNAEWGAFLLPPNPFGYSRIGKKSWLPEYIPTNHPNIHIAPVLCHETPATWRV